MTIIEDEKEIERIMEEFPAGKVLFWKRDGWPLPQRGTVPLGKDPKTGRHMDRLKCDAFAPTLSIDRQVDDIDDAYIEDCYCTYDGKWLVRDEEATKAMIKDARHDAILFDVLTKGGLSYWKDEQVMEPHLEISDGVYGVVSWVKGDFQRIPEGWPCILRPVHIEPHTYTNGAYVRSTQLYAIPYGYGVGFNTVTQVETFRPDNNGDDDWHVAHKNHDVVNSFPCVWWDRHERVFKAQNVLDEPRHNMWAFRIDGNILTTENAKGYAVPKGDK